MGTEGKGKGERDERTRKRRRKNAELLSSWMRATEKAQRYRITSAPTDADGIEAYMRAHSRPLPRSIEEIHEENTMRPDRGPF